MKMDFNNKITEIKDNALQNNLTNTIPFSDLKDNSGNNLLHTFSQK